MFYVAPPRRNEHGCLLDGHKAKPCYMHGTPGCTLIVHRSPAGQRIEDQPRCVRCGRVMSSSRHYEDQPCDSCRDRA